MNKEKLVQYLIANGKTHSWAELAEMFNYLPNLTRKQRSDAVRRLYGSLDIIPLEEVTIKVVDSTNLDEFEEFMQWKKSRTKRVKKEAIKIIAPFEGGDPNNVLVIGDLHEPFCLDGYLEFCREQQERFNCGYVVFIGDVIDFHYSSFHPSNPDGYGAGEELQRAIVKLQNWHTTFPHAIVTLGNHDRIVARKLYAAGISTRFMKPLHEVFETPTWRYVEEHEYKDVLYIHGESGTAKTKSKDEAMSVVQGHAHTEAYVDLSVGRKYHRFSMQVGTGIDFEAYAFAYAQRGKKPVTSCGVVLNGQYPIIIPFNA